MGSFFTLCQPADFSEWGGDDADLMGEVWQEFVDEVERRRCERWSRTWLITRDCSDHHVWGGVSRLSEANMEQLVANGFLREVTSAEFEGAWTLADAHGVELVTGHEDKVALVRATHDG